MDDHNDTPENPDTNDSVPKAEVASQQSAPGSAGGKRRQEGLTDQERSDLGRSGAAARWAGHLSTRQVNRTAHAVLAKWVALADLDPARPAREGGLVDELITPPDLGWIASVQVRGIAADGMKVHRAFVGFPIVLVYVWLGANDGGSTHRAQTTMAVLDPQTAWALPDRLGLARDEENTTYRWSRITRNLSQALDPFTARTPAELADLLSKAATHRPEHVSPA